MKLIWHIAAKDAKRLWWEIAITLSLNAALVWREARRLDSASAPWWPLSLLLPLAWLVFIARLVHGERLVGDEAWWLTRPYSRANLVAAKLLLVLAIVHLVPFIGDCLILGAKGFVPLHHFAPLFAKQGMWLVGLTLPALAMASVSQGIGQFMIGVVMLLSVTGIAANVASGIPMIGGDPVRSGLVLGLMAVVTLAVFGWQYVRRRWIATRILLGLGTVAAFALFMSIPARWSVALAYQAAGVGPRVEPSLRPGSIAYQGPPKSSVWLLPVDLEEEHPSMDWSREWAWAEVRSETVRVSPRYTFWHSPELAGGNLSLMVEPEDAARLKGLKVDVEARVALREWRNVPGGRLRVNGEAKLVNGLGLCGAASELTGPTVDVLVVSCESPSPLPLLIRLDLVTREGRVLRRSLAESAGHIQIPIMNWLSPVNRLEGRFSLPAVPNGWQVPREPAVMTEVVVYRQERVRRGLRTIKWTGLDWEKYTAGQ